MRITLFLIFCVFSSIAEAQLFAPGALPGMRPSLASQQYLLSDSNSLKKKWSFNKYGSLSTGFSLFNGGSATFVSAPVGLQLNRRLNNNLFAFAGVMIAPTYMSFNRPLQGFDPYKTGSLNNKINNFGVYSRAEAGLMYINDERTFSISGSIGIDRSSYPGLYYPAAPLLNQRAPTFYGNR